MVQQDHGWAGARSTLLGSEVTLIGGVLATLTGFAIAGQSSPSLVANLGGVAAMLIFVAGLLLLSRGAGSRASAGFASFIAAGLLLMVSLVAAPGAALYASVVILGSIASLVGGLLLIAPLTAMTGGAGLGRGSGLLFLVGGVIQVAAGIPDAIGAVENSAYLQDISTPIYGLAAIFFAVAAPALLYLAVRRLRSKSSA